MAEVKIILQGVFVVLGLCSFLSILEILIIYRYLFLIDLV